MGLSSFNRMRKQQTALRDEMKSTDGIDISKKTKDELRIIAKELGLTGYSNLLKEELMKAILEAYKGSKEEITNPEETENPEE